MAKILCVLFALLPMPIWACSCAVQPVQYCQKPPDVNNNRQAIFVGVVKEFYPASRQQMNQLRDEFYRSHPELRPQSGNNSGRLIAGAIPDDQEFRREFIRFLWGNTLTAAEQEQLRTADRPTLDRLLFDYRRRARLQVLENFSNAENPDFDLITNLDEPSCGFDFAVGSTYLIEANRNTAESRWKVESCNPPRLIDSATDEVNALRAWKAGRPPKARIFGNIFSRTGLDVPSGVRLQLQNGLNTRGTISGPAGEFSFEDLELANYRLQWGTQTRSIDMTGAWCARVNIPLASITPTK